MLILTRRAGEALRIGDEIEVTVMAVNGSQVRIGINAPRTSRWTARRSPSASAAIARRSPPARRACPAEGNAALRRPYAARARPAPILRSAS
jgi:hypothetical protein